MKKLLFVAMMLAASDAVFGDYAYLYWEVDPGSDSGWLADGRAFDYAQIKAVTANDGTIVSDALGNYDAFGNGPIKNVWSGDPSPSLRTDAPAYADISAYASDLYGFIVEAYLDGDLLWTSGAKYYDKLVAANSIWRGDPSSLSGDLAVATYMVPEPSSAVLLLIGLGGLSLRRRRRG